MSIIDSLLAILAPYDCLACGAEGDLLCSACKGSITPVGSCCYRCEISTIDSRTCESCQRLTPLEQVFATTRYNGLAKQIIWGLKSGGAQKAADVMASQMRVEFTKNSRVIIVPIPTATSRIRSRGYDQTALLARSLSAKSGVPVTRCLARVGQAHQVGSSRKIRLQQLNGSFRLKSRHSIKGAAVILVDDVVTTGASLEAVAKVLKSAGACKVTATVYARTPSTLNLSSKKTTTGSS